MRGLRRTRTAAHLGAAQPKVGVRERIDAVERTIDVERAAETARTATEIARTLDGAASLHELQTFDRFERANQNAGAFAVTFA